MKHLSHNLATIAEESLPTRHDLSKGPIPTNQAENQFEIAARRAREGVVRPYVAFVVQRLIRRTIT